MLTGQQVHAGTLNAYLTALARRGVSTPDILSKLQLKPAQLGGESRVDLEKFVELQRMASRYVHDPAINLKAGAEFPSNAMGALQILLASRKTLRNCFEDICRYSRFISEYASYELICSGRLAQFRKILQVPEELLTEDQGLFCLSAFYGSLRKLSIQDWHPSAVRLRRSPSSAHSSITDYFGCQVFYDCEVDELVFPATILNQCLITENPSLALTIEKYLFSQGGETSPTTSDRVTSLISKNISSRILSVEEIARELNCSKRNLQRLLKLEKTSYHFILDEIRKGLAEYYIGCGLNTQSTSEKLGFSDPRSFNRAFRRWFAATPKQLKKPSPEL